jgi:hypothetical protein
MATPDNERLVAPLRVIALFNGGIKSITINMGYAELIEFRMGDQARGMTLRAAPLPVLAVVKAIAAQAVHVEGLLCGGAPVVALSTAWACMID